MRVDLPHVHAANLDHAGCSIPEAGDQARGCGLAAARRADKRHGLPGFCGKGDMGEGGDFRTVIGKADVPERNFVAVRRLRVHGYRQGRGLHHRGHAAERRARQHNTARGEHDAGQRRGDDGGEHRVKRKIRDKSREIAGRQRAGRQQQRHRHEKNECAFSEGQIDRLRQTAHFGLIICRLVAVFVNGLLKRLEGIHGLLEDLNHRNAAHILGARLGDAVERCLIFRHELGVFAAHHGGHGDDRNHRRQQAGRAHAPVEHKHQHHHGHE